MQSLPSSDRESVFEPFPQDAATVITGAASGIGLAVARRLVNRTRVIMVDNDASALAEAAEELDDVAGSESGASRVISVTADVTDPTWLEPAWDAMFEPMRLAAMIMCAGVACPGTVDEPDPDRWRRVIEVNGLGVMYSVREAVRLMRRHGGGSIVALASVAGRATYVGEPAYVASKHAVVGFCESVRRELAGSGIRISLIEPGFVATPMTLKDATMAERMGGLVPLEPIDVARAVEFVLEQPPHANVTELIVRPSQQDL